MKQGSPGAWGGVFCCSDPGCSSGTPKKHIARIVVFSRGAIAVMRGCPGENVRCGVQQRSPTSDADGCFVLGKACGGIPDMLRCCPPSPRAGRFLCFFTFPSCAPRGTSDALAKQCLGSPNSKWDLDPFPGSGHSPLLRASDVKSLWWHSFTRLKTQTRQVI